MTSKATKEALELHRLLVEELTQRIKNGTAETADLSVARQLLKDNGVDYLLVKEDTPIHKLTQALPFVSPDGVDRTGT